MLPRRSLLVLTAAIAAVTLRSAIAAPATETASRFITDVGDRLVRIVNANVSAAQREAALQAVVDSDVNVAGIAKFCLGRYWRVATPEQRRQYETLFRKVLMISLTARLGDYRGVRLTVGRATQRAEGTVVESTITKPNKAPVNVQWVVETANGRPQIIDVLAEGTSLRLTQRDDYASFIAGHNQSVQALIDALRKQVSSNA